MTWEDAKQRQRCSCTRSDAWRCENDKPLRGRLIACRCRCHNYIQEPEAQAADDAAFQQFADLLTDEAFDEL